MRDSLRRDTLADSERRGLDREYVTLAYSEGRGARWRVSVLNVNN